MGSVKPDTPCAWRGPAPFLRYERGKQRPSRTDRRAAAHQTPFARLLDAHSSTLVLTKAITRGLGRLAVPRVTEVTARSRRATVSRIRKTGTLSPRGSLHSRQRSFCGEPRNKPVALSLPSIGVTPRGMAALLGSPMVSRLEVLDLRDNLLDASGAKILAESRRLAALVELNLACNYLHEDGAVALARARGLRKLKRLELGYNFHRSRRRAGVRSEQRTAAARGSRRRSTWRSARPALTLRRFN
jgi:hypothetical protein